MEDASKFLPNLSNLFREFYHHATHNDRKREIEFTLSMFEQEKEAWRCCFKCLQYVLIHPSSSCQYTTMFCLKVIEVKINKYWADLTTEEKNEFKDNLLSLTLTYDLHFVRKKCMKMMVDIVRLDCPNDYTPFFTQIFHLFTVPETTVLGAEFLQIASEEFINPREDLCTDRKDELKNHFLAQIPRLLNLLRSKLRHNYNSTDEMLISMLKTTCQIYSWLPMNQLYFNEEAILILGEYSFHKNYKIRLLAMCGMNEILYKTCIPLDCVYLIIKISVYLNAILKAIMEDNFNSLDQDYISKILEMARLLFSSHWHKLECECEDNFEPSVALSTSFYQFTFRDLPPNYYYECLDVWSQFLSYLSMKKDPSHLNKYGDLLISLARSVIEKMQKADHSFENLKDVCEEPFHVDDISFVGKLADVMPEKICCNILEGWRLLGKFYTNLLFLNGQMREADMEEAAGLLRRFEIAVQVLSAVNALLELSTVHDVTLELSLLVMAANRVSLHKRPNLAPISASLIRLHCQLLGALRLWLPSCVEKAPISDLYSCTLPFVLERETDNNVANAAANLLAYLVEYVQDAALLQPLLANPLLSHLTKQGEIDVQRSLCDKIIKDNSIGEEEARREFLTKLFQAVIGENLKNIDQATAILRGSRVTNVNNRRLLFATLQPWLQQILSQFPQWLSQHASKCEKMLGFFLQSFETMQDQMDSEFMQRAIQVFINSFTTSTYGSIPGNEGDGGVEKLMQLLTLIVEEPNVTFKHFIPSCISLCMQHLHPAAVSRNECPTTCTATPALFKLLASILSHKWQYFYKGSQFDCKQLLENRHEFEAILTAFLHSFQGQSDMTFYSTNLHFLEDLNRKWKLYHKDAFKFRYLPPFLTILFNTLIEDLHSPYSEDVCVAIYNLAAVDFAAFYSQYIPLLLSQIAGLDDSQRATLKNNFKRDTDIPSFLQNVSRFANDIRCYKCNAHGTSPSSANVILM